MSYKKLEDRIISTSLFIKNKQILLLENEYRKLIGKFKIVNRLHKSENWVIPFIFTNTLTDQLYHIFINGKYVNKRSSIHELLICITMNNDIVTIYRLPEILKPFGNLIEMPNFENINTTV